MFIKPFEHIQTEDQITFSSQNLHERIAQLEASLSATEAQRDYWKHEAEKIKKESSDNAKVTKDFREPEFIDSNVYAEED